MEAATLQSKARFGERAIFAGTDQFWSSANDHWDAPYNIPALPVFIISDMMGATSQLSSSDKSLLTRLLSVTLAPHIRLHSQLQYAHRSDCSTLGLPLDVWDGAIEVHQADE